MTLTPERILVARVGRAGDMVMITPALGALLEAWPDAEMHLLTGPEGRRVLRGFDSRLVHFWEYDRRFPKGMLRRRRVVRELRAQGYTRAYVFESNSHYHRLLGDAAGQVYHLDDSTTGTHFCRRCLDLVATSTGRPVENRWVTLPVNDNGVASARELLATHGIGDDDVVVGLHPTFSGSSWLGLRDRKGARHRVWPLESFARFAALLDKRCREADVRARIVVDALPEERRMIEPVVRGSGDVVTILSEPPDFDRYKGLLARMDVLVSPNTGPMHMAAAVGTRVTALFSGWSVEECGPYVPPENCAVLRAEDTESPENGLAAIEPEVVVDAVMALLPGVRV